MRRTAVRLLLMIGLCLIFAVGARADARLLLYMIGGDLETDSGAATADLLELTRAQIPAQVRVFARIGGAKTLWLPGLMDGHTQDLALEEGIWTPAWDGGDQPMTEASCLTDFIRRYRKAEDTNVLILWGHGDGAHSAIGVDQRAGNARISLPEVDHALAAAGVHFDMIGLDACGMATLEAAWRICAYADVFAASASPEPLSGWSYARWPARLDQPAAAWLPLMRQENDRSLTRADQGTGLVVIRAASLSASEDALRTALDRSIRAGDSQTVGEIMPPDTDGTDAQIDVDVSRLLLPCDPEAAAALEHIGESYAAWFLRRQ